MAELRTEITDLATRLDTGYLALQREALAMRTMYDALKKRADDEIAGQYESDKLTALEPRLAALESAMKDAAGEPAGKKSAATATTHAKTEHK